MKKIIYSLSFVIASSSLSYGQDKTGVETTTPTEILDVNGTLRVRDLPIDGTGTIYNGAASKNTTFTATKTIVADANGNMGTVDRVPTSEPFRVENTSDEATENTQNIYQNGNVGIGDFSTSTIDNALHVKATQDPLKLEGLQGSTVSTDKVLVVDQNGVVKTDLSSSTEFVGFLTSNQTTYGQQISRINVDNELLDAGSEFNTTNYTFTPNETGVYKIEITITSTSYSNGGGYPDYNGFEEERAVTGLAQVVSGGSDQWVCRFAFNGSRDQRAVTFTGSALLQQGESYYFGIVGAQYYPGTVLYANPTGSSGSGRGTYFSVSRID